MQTDTEFKTCPKCKAGWEQSIYQPAAYCPQCGAGLTAAKPQSIAHFACGLQLEDEDD